MRARSKRRAGMLLEVGRRHRSSAARRLDQMLVEVAGLGYSIDRHHQNVPISVERSAERMTISTPNTHAEIEVMKGKNGKPIKIENLPSPDFPAPPYLDHTQYRSVILKHEAEDKQFEYSGTNGFTAKIEAVAADGD